MVRQITSTCMATLKDGITVPSPDMEDRQHLTLKEELCDPDSDCDDMDQDDDDDDDEEDEHDSIWRRFLMSSHCTVCLYLSLILLLLGSIVAIVVVSVQVVLPYRHVVNYRNATCIPYGVAVHGDNTCMCGAGCSAKYRCLTIHVSYQDRQKTWRNATVYENESTLGKQVWIVNRSG